MFAHVCTYVNTRAHPLSPLHHHQPHIYTHPTHPTHPKPTTTAQGKQYFTLVNSMVSTYTARVAALAHPLFMQLVQSVMFGVQVRRAYACRYFIPPIHRAMMTNTPLPLPLHPTHAPHPTLYQHSHKTP